EDASRARSPTTQAGRRRPAGRRLPRFRVHPGPPVPPAGLAGQRHPGVERSPCGREPTRRWPHLPPVSRSAAAKVPPHRVANRGVVMSVRRLVLPVLAAVAAVLLVTTPAAALPAFGTAPVSGAGSVSTPWSETGEGVSSVTVGHHAGYDRAVFTFRDHTRHFEVGYVSGVSQDASDAPVPLRGSAFLLVVLRGNTMGLSVQRAITP